MRSVRLRLLTAVSVTMLVPVSSASAGEFIADGVPVATVVDAAAKPLGVPSRVCSGGDAPVTGRFNFADGASIASLLRAKGLPVVFDGTRLSIGCDRASVETPETGALPGWVPQGNPLDPTMVPVRSEAPSAPPPTFEQVTARYRDPSKLLAVMSKIPGLSVIADPDIPGPLLIAGPPAIVKQAKAFMAALDRCPDQLEIEAVVIASADVSDRSRRFGVQVHLSHDTVIGGLDPLSSATLRIPGLRAYLDGLRSTSNVRQNAAFTSRVLLGQTVKLEDGQDVPIRAATSVTAVETRADVAYRSIGHQLSVKVEAIDQEAVVTVAHELSSIAGQTSLGPSFATRSTATTMRVKLGEPVMVSLAGSDLADAEHSKGIFSRSDATSVSRGGLFLVFALRRLGCEAEAGGAEPLQAQPDRPDEAPKRKAAKEAS